MLDRLDVLLLMSSQITQCSLSLFLFVCLFFSKNPPGNLQSTLAYDDLWDVFIFRGTVKFGFTRDVK